jgi:hypothetical protein
MTPRCVVLSITRRCVIPFDFVLSARRDRFKTKEKRRRRRRIKYFFPTSHPASHSHFPVPGKSETGSSELPGTKESQEFPGSKYSLPGSCKTLCRLQLPATLGYDSSAQPCCRRSTDSISDSPTQNTCHTRVRTPATMYLRT